MTQRELKRRLGWWATASRPMRRIVRGTVAVLPASLIGLAALLTALRAVDLELRFLGPLPALLPVASGESPRPAAAAAAIGLAALAIGLARAKRAAWWMSIVVLLPGLLVQLAMLRHPISASLAAASLLVLILDRGRYRVETGATSRRAALLLYGAGGLIALATIALAIGTKVGWVPRGASIADLAGALTSWLAFEDPTVVANTIGDGALLVILVIVARFAIAFGLVRLLGPADTPPLDAEMRLHARDVGRQFGAGALLPFQLGADKEYFVLPQRRGVVAYGRHGRVAVALGDPIGEPHDAAAVLAAFVRECRVRDWIPSVYQASEQARSLLRRLGFVTYRVGQEALIDLTSFDLSGSRRANLRHTVTRAQRGGVEVRWYRDGLGEEESQLHAAIVAIDHAWQGNRPQMGFTISRFDPRDLRYNAVSVAFDAQGAPIAFATFRRTGGDGGWVLDLLRRVPGGVPGAMEACVAEAALAMRRDGATCLSLGLAPLAGLRVGEGSPVERLLALGARAIRPAYDVAGLAFFKRKFDPRWENRYLAVRHRTQLPAVTLGLLGLHLGGSRGLWRAARAELPHLRRAHGTA